MEQRFGLGDRLSLRRSAHFNPHPGINLAEKSECQYCCFVADDTAHHDFSHRCDSLQHIPRKTTTIGRRDFFDRPYIWLLRLHDRFVDHERPYASLSSLYRLSGQRWMGQHRTFLSRGNHHPIMVLPWP